MDKLTKEQIDNLPEWMPVRDFEWLYEVNCRAGLVRNSRTLRVLKQNPNSDRYLTVGLCKYGKMYTKTVHRIVANAAFGYHNISTDGLFVMHLDEERNNPSISNLALGTNKENLSFPKARKRLSEAARGEKNHWFGKHHSAEARMKIAECVKRKQSKRVGAYKNGELILTFESTAEAARNGFSNGNVSRCCTGRLKTYKGYKWYYI